MMQNNFTKQIAEIVIRLYPDYKELNKNKDFILSEITKEENRFRQSLSSGLKKFNKLTGKTIPGKEAFFLFHMVFYSLRFWSFFYYFFDIVFYSL